MGTNITTPAPSAHAASLEAPPPPARRRAGLLLISSFVLLVGVVVVAATAPVNAALQEAARGLGIDVYTNGSLPLDVQAAVLAEHSGSTSDVALGIASVLVWALYVVAIWAATGLRRPPGALGWTARIAALGALGAWVAMLAFDALLADRGAAFANYYSLWFTAEGLLGAGTGIATLALVASLIAQPPLLRRRAGRVLVVVAAVLALASAVLPFLGAGLPPVLGPLLGCIVGIMLLRTPRGPSSA